MPAFALSTSWPAFRMTAGHDAPSPASDSIVKQPRRGIFVARMKRSEIRELSPRQESRIALRFIRATSRRASSPLVHVRLGVRRSSFAFLARRVVRNDRAFHRARGAMCEHMAPCAEAHGKQTASEAAHTPAFRTRMDFAACCMSRGLSLAPTRPRSCELSPGHALGPSARVAGVCPHPLRPYFQISSVRGATSWRPPHPAPHLEDARDAPLAGPGRLINIPSRAAKSSDEEENLQDLFSENQKKMTA
jgi:hypothetical protein